MDTFQAYGKCLVNDANLHNRVDLPHKAKSMGDEKEAEFLELRYLQERFQSLREINGPDTEAIESQAT